MKLSKGNKSFAPDPKIVAFKEEVFKRAAKVASFIYQIGESESLRKVSKEVSIKVIDTPKFKAKIQYLKKCLLRYRKLTGVGRGITAVQVGIPEKFSVIYKTRLINQKTNTVGSLKDLMVIINPKITKSSRKISIYNEGCMSASPIIAPTKRPTWIEFEYLDEDGKKQFWDIKDDTDYGKMMNRVFMHEIDHMQGIINIDLCKSKDLFLESDPKAYQSASFKKVN